MAASSSTWKVSSRGANERGVHVQDERDWRNWSKWADKPAETPRRGARLRLPIDGSGVVPSLEVLDQAAATGESPDRATATSAVRWPSRLRHSWRVRSPSFAKRSMSSTCSRSRTRSSPGSRKEERMTIDREKAHAELDEWLEAVGPDLEDDFWDMLCNEAKACIELIQKLTHRTEESD